MPTKTKQRSDISAILSGTRRLHISPLTEALLPRVLGAYLPVAQDISFHEVPNFPSKAYGFVTLPAAEAAMVRKKLNGTILRGEKVAVEDARPDARKEKADEERAIDGSETEPTARSMRKRKREIDVIPAAVVLPEDRKVRRGWTETKAEMEAKKIKEKKEKKDAKKEKKSKLKTSTYTDQAECLFETTLPDNAKGETSKDKRDRKKKSKKGMETVTIHEFEKTTKYPSYLRQATSDKQKVQEYDEEKGWVDEAGNVVEGAVKTTNPRRTTRSNAGEQAIETKAQQQPADDDDDETSSSGSSADESSKKSQSESEEEAEEEQLVSSPPRPPPEVSVSITASSPATPHPLETLFKKPQTRATPKAGLEIDTSFSFFSNDNEASDTESRPKVEKSLETPGLPALKRRGLPNLSIPVTPFSQKDMSWRAQRSAAPTPDTAAPGKSSFGDPFGLLAAGRDRESDIEEEDEDEHEGVDEADGVMQGIENGQAALDGSSASKAEKPASEFSKWFWENRGNNTKAWKKRKREAAKEQKSRENRKRKA